MTAGEPTPEERRALFRVVRGEPTDEELAALTVVLAAVASGAGGAGGAERPRSRPVWGDPEATLRRPLAAGPGAWRTTYWPR
ncbi:acyl-CoA carboxylase subunit epsilon [Pseudonocardia sp.]|uniref:acyl-CoA carboxylase subunit epsilon n=1 Tax=Pseudonocardia sp. TaxID=60912 RepID=UPI003D0F757E